MRRSDCTCSVVGCIGMQLETPCLPLSFSMLYELKHGIDEWCKFLGLYTHSLSDSGWIDAELFKGWCSNLQFSKDILMIDNNKKNSELVQEAQIYIYTHDRMKA